MKNIRRFAIASVALALGLPAAAQSAETAAPSTTSARPSVAAAPAYTTHQSGSSKAVLKAFGPYITQSNVGAGGADVSELYTAQGYTVYGYGMQGGTIQNTMADDFVVPTGQSWNVTNFKWLTYQTGAPTTGTITAMYMNLFNTNPTGQTNGAAWKLGGNVYQSKTWTGVNRVLDTNVLASDRVIIEVTCNGGFAGSLSAGTYWLTCNAEGSLTSGPWAPPETKPGQIPGQNPQWNGLQAIGTAGAFALVVNSTDNQDMLFQVEGTGGGGVGTFCTSKPSSIIGCVPVLSAAAGTVSKSGAPANGMVATPVPGGGGLPGIVIYTKNGLLANPVLTNFGWLCLNQFARAGAFPATPGGTAGTCSGTYNWNLAAIVAASTLVAGDTVHAQAWYRDPPNVGAANFTNGVGPISVVP